MPLSWPETGMAIAWCSATVKIASVPSSARLHANEKSTSVGIKSGGIQVKSNESQLSQHCQSKIEAKLRVLSKARRQQASGPAVTNFEHGRSHVHDFLLTFVEPRRMLCPCKVVLIGPPHLQRPHTLSRQNLNVRVVKDDSFVTIVNDGRWTVKDNNLVPHLGALGCDCVNHAMFCHCQGGKQQCKTRDHDLLRWQNVGCQNFSFAWLGPTQIVIQ